MLVNPNQTTYEGLDNDVFVHLRKEICQYLQDSDINTPTEIQARALPPALARHDLIAQAPTGSGKTLAFLIPMGMRIGGNQSKKPKGIVLTPTRELATQVASVSKDMLGRLGLRTLSIIGGASYHDQKKMLRNGTDIVIGTPGRICDLLERGELKLEDLEIFVLDEVDQMLEEGFADDLNKIRDKLPSHIQTLLFSATFTPRIRNLAKSLMISPREVRCSEKLAPASIQHRYLEANEGDEMKVLINTLLFHNPDQAIIFCETRKDCMNVARELTRRNFDAQAIHGDLGQAERNLTMNCLRRGRLQYLVATNIAARGIDVQGLPMVINLEVPKQLDAYTHRAGRTGRAGNEGQAWTIVTKRSARLYHMIMHRMKIKPEKISVSGPGDIAHRVLEQRTAAARSAQFQQGSQMESAIERVMSSLKAEDKEAILVGLLTQQLKDIRCYDLAKIIPAKPIYRHNSSEYTRKPRARDHKRFHRSRNTFSRSTRQKRFKS